MQDPEFVKQAFGDIADRYVLTNHVLSAGTDVLWRRKVAKIVAGFDPASVLDLATGSGDLAAAVAKSCPDAHVVGADFCLPMMRHARTRGLENLMVADAMDLPFADGTFDVVTVAFGLRNMASWPDALREMSRVLRSEGGSLVILDFSLPTGILRRPYRFYLHSILPKLAGAITGSKEAYEYLGGSIEKFPSGEAMCELMRGNGFVTADATPLTGSIASIYVARK